MEDISTQYTPQQVWDTVKGELQSLLSAETYSEWFACMQLVSCEGDNYVLSANNDFAAMWISDNYSDLLRRHISMALGRNASVKVLCQNNDTSSQQAELPVETPRAVSLPKSKPKAPNINPKNTFENFIIGESNQLAHAVALAVANAPGRVYNPMCIYGSTGLGKTHLMHAIAHFVFKNNPEMSIVYTTSERFLNEYIRDIKDGKMAEFRKRYRNVDVLMIDDIQFFAGKTGIQEEFFHTFNDLFESGKQIVLTSDRPFNEIPKLEERLISRFEWGYSADIQTPNYETRLAILMKKASAMGFEASPEILDFVARKITKNVRRLEGALNRLSGYAAVVKTPLTLEKAQELLADFLSQDVGNLDIQKIQETVASYFHIDIAEITGRRRTANIVTARQIAMYLSKTLMKEKTLEEIGRQFGGRDHGTVIHAMKVVGEQMECEPSIKGYVDHFIKVLSE